MRKRDKERRGEGVERESVKIEAERRRGQEDGKKGERKGVQSVV